MTKEKTTKSKKSKAKSKGHKTRNIILLVVCILFIFGTAFGYWLYRTVLSANVKTGEEKETVIYIPTGSDFNAVMDTLNSQGLLVRESSFRWVANRKKYPENIKPGRYVVCDRMSNNNLVNMLRGGWQSPVNVTFNYMRNVDMLAGKIGKQIEADSASIAKLLHDKDYVGKLGFNERTLPAMFLPDTYEFYWNTDAESFISRMLQEYNKFWNEDRKKAAKDKGLSPVEVSILASIVDKETNKTDEMPRIAGVYINRLHSNWLLQADPTLIFAIGDFSIKRVLNVHKEIESPYNTYKYIGLPPGPICIPSVAAVKAVLNAENHNYFYFCAKEDFSGYHNFAKTLTEHNHNALKYQSALNQRGIR
ncbi:MAG: endolytic transglycosylase MltG [Bacteroidales bacterium]|nr:endolytic transglycosylase MltG [Bacteroidales bacterium]